MYKINSTKKTIYNIVNGDHLKNLLEKDYSNLLVMREALMQGPIQETDINSFFEKRALFISNEYKACTKEKYLEGMDEFHKIKKIEDGAEINLWFGKDVFCQINFWFLINFQQEKFDTNDFYLISPKECQDCSFTNKEKRVVSFEKKLLISKKELKIFSKLWNLFVNKQYLKIQEEIQKIESKYTFIKETVEAILNMGKVEEEIQKLSTEEKDFYKLFDKVSKTYSIYGYGDLQIKYISKS